MRHLFLNQLALPVTLVALVYQPVGFRRACISDGASWLQRTSQDRESTIRVPDGTVLLLLVADSVSGKTAKTNDPVQLRVMDEVKIGDLVVIANKASALASIAELQHAGRRLRAGTMAIKLDRVTL